MYIVTNKLGGKGSCRGGGGCFYLQLGLFFSYIHIQIQKSNEAHYLEQ